MTIRTTKSSPAQARHRIFDTMPPMVWLAA